MSTIDVRSPSASSSVGCFCNRGAAEAAFRFDAGRVSRSLDSLGRDFSVQALQRCLGPDVPAGALRAPFGPANESRDLRRALDVIASFAA